MPLRISINIDVVPIVGACMLFDFAFLKTVVIDDQFRN
jgi:hypothetical protein